MKTKTQITALALIIAVMFATNIFAQNRDISLEEETNIEDIPSDSQAIAEACLLNEAMNVEFDFEEEAYIDDIPYNTYEVAKNYKTEEYLKKAFDFDEEEYIDDIPFNTEKIFNEVFFTVYFKYEK